MPVTSKCVHTYIDPLLRLQGVNPPLAPPGAYMRLHEPGGLLPDGGAIEAVVDSLQHLSLTAMDEKKRNVSGARRL